ncbi:MAG: hypothetical protein JJT89_11290 [Nitriliruptoraceae bacterium]|nr:hypothetical protein [Nitriliruptoraceae bacterium]
MEHPGRRPPDLVFPFDQARDAQQHAAALASSLEALIDQHRSAANELVVGFEGAPRRDLEVALTEALARLRDHAEALRDQAADIGRATEQARTQLDARRRAQRSYDLRLQDWRRAQADPTAVGQR